VEAGHGDTELDSLRHEHREQKFKIWKDRFDDVCILNVDTLRTKLDYIHNNPLQPHWQLALKPEDYLYSSAAFYEREGTSPLNVTNFIEFIW
jgi:putative transposase